MTAQFQYSRLSHQKDAVDAIDRVFEDVHFFVPNGAQANPVFKLEHDGLQIRNNIRAIRQSGSINAGRVDVSFSPTPALSLDILMETGTGKTFTFIETIHRLHRRYKLSKFIILVPSHAIRQGTLKSLQTTAAFFSREYDNQKINVYNYSAKTVGGFIHAANGTISVMVATFQSFNRESAVINKRGVEASLFGQAKSYMEALAAIRPVIIMDEPHRFEGKQTQEYLAKFKPLMTLRFGATFKGETDDERYTNLIYTLDSMEAFRQNLVKSITVDTVGHGAESGNTLSLDSVSGAAGARVAHLSVHAPDGKRQTVTLKVKDNLGEATGLEYLRGHVVDNITTKELTFTNGFDLVLGHSVPYGMLAEDMQRLIIERTISNHFEREEALFKRGVKSLSLFFIDSVAKYMPEGGKPATIREQFERLYAAQLRQMLSRDDLDAGYRRYLERSQADISRVHKGYFARSMSEKGEEEAIALILRDKEQLLSFETDLRFIFSMWALQEGWDNPNVMTLCKLAPSQSRITKLQQIGRGLRLAVNQQLERITTADEHFEAVNELVVVVPATEGDFVKGIQSEIAGASLKGVALEFDEQALVLFGLAPSPRLAVKVQDALAAIGVVSVDDKTGVATVLVNRATLESKRAAIVRAISGIAALMEEVSDAPQRMMDYLETALGTYGRIKEKQPRKPQQLTIKPSHYEQFKALWAQLSREAVVHYEIETDALVNSVLRAIDQDFDLKPLVINTTRHTDVQNAGEVRSSSTPYLIKAQSIYTLGEFIRTLAQQTTLSLHVVSRILREMPREKFVLIGQNENRALQLLKSIMTHCLLDLAVASVRYEMREIRIKKTALTQSDGPLHQSIPYTLCGKELHEITNSVVAGKSLYQEPLMPVDSQIERDTTDESHSEDITVFAKLPKLDIPTPSGHYNPDFAYVIAREGNPQALYLVVETKGYDTPQQIGRDEARKINSARRFFTALQNSGVPVQYKTKLNGETLLSLTQDILCA
jgi:type III restriction enzyme